MQFLFGSPMSWRPPMTEIVGDTVVKWSKSYNVGKHALLADDASDNAVDDAGDDTDAAADDDHMLMMLLSRAGIPRDPLCSASTSALLSMCGSYLD